MVYTLTGYLRESIAELVRERKERVQKEENERERLEEEVRFDLVPAAPWVLSRAPCWTPADPFFRFNPTLHCRPVRQTIALQAIAVKTAGTKVTPESFAAWKIKFEAEMEAKRVKEEQDRVKALPPKEREEVKKWSGKLSGASISSLRGNGRSLRREESLTSPFRPLPLRPPCHFAHTHRSRAIRVGEERVSHHL